MLTRSLILILLHQAVHGPSPPTELNSASYLCKTRIQKLELALNPKPGTLNPETWFWSPVALWSVSPSGLRLREINGCFTKASCTYIVYTYWGLREAHVMKVLSSLSMYYMGTSSLGDALVQRVIVRFPSSTEWKYLQGNLNQHSQNSLTWSNLTMFKNHTNLSLWRWYLNLKPWTLNP